MTGYPSAQSNTAMESSAKIIAVFGATGQHGQGLVRAICNDPGGGFTARAVTRDPSSAKARALAELGAEIVQCDVNCPEQVESALRGAYGALFVTWSFEPKPDPEAEMNIIKTYAEAAKAAGIKHAIFSTTEDTSQWVPLDDDSMPTIKSPNGSWKVPHFEAKAQAERFFVRNAVPTTFLLVGFYYDNLLTLFPPTMGEDGKWAFTIPICDKRIAWVAAEDIGRSAYGIFKGGVEKYAWRHLPCGGEHMTLAELVAKFATKFKMKVEDFNTNASVTPGIFRAFGFPGCAELANMFQFEMDFNEVYCANRDVEMTRTYNSTLMSFEEWLAKNKEQIPWVGKQGGLEAGGGDADVVAEDTPKNIEDIGFSLTLAPDAARARSAMIQQQVDISKQLDVWHEAFKTMDSDDDGELSLAEAKAAGISEEEFKKLDKGGKGCLTKEEFVSQMTGAVESDLATARAKFFISGASGISRERAARAGVRGSVVEGGGMQLSRERAVRSGVRASVFDNLGIGADGQLSVAGLAEYLTTHQMTEAAASPSSKKQ